MADAFKLIGSYEVDPLTSQLSFAPSTLAPINEARTIEVKQETDVNLSSDSPAAVPFGGVTDANIVILKVASGGPVTLSITSDAGSAQLVPMDSYFILMSGTVPVTAISVTRAAGVPTVLRVFLAELA